MRPKRTVFFNNFTINIRDYYNEYTYKVLQIRSASNLFLVKTSDLKLTANKSPSFTVLKGKQTILKTSIN